MSGAVQVQRQRSLLLRFSQEILVFNGEIKSQDKMDKIELQPFLVRLHNYLFKLYLVRSISTFSAPVLFSTKMYEK